MPAPGCNISQDVSSAEYTYLGTRSLAHLMKEMGGKNKTFLTFIFQGLLWIANELA